MILESRWGPWARGQVWIDVAVGRGVGGGDPEVFRSLAFMVSLGLEVIPEDADSHGASTW